MAIEPGDVVILKSGGQPMTVVSVEDRDEIDCVWMGDDGHLCRESIPAAALIGVPSEEDEDEDEDEHEHKEEDEAEDEETGEDDEEEKSKDRGKTKRRVA